MLLLFSALAGTFLSRSQDVSPGENTLVGFCDREGLENSEMGEDFRVFYEAYLPDDGVIEALGPLMESVTIITVLGTWCSDSQEQVPAFYHILDSIGYDMSGMKLICVDRDKLAGGLDLSAFSVVKVPTFIFYREGKEIGRITETPQQTLELDMLVIVED